jgi:N-glycosylase/DNA lyase
MTSYNAQNLSDAVAAICPDIRLRVEGSAVPDERILWWELSTCILSSQVPYSLAVAAANAIDSEELLVDENVESETLSSRLTQLLRAPLSVDGTLRGYRFPSIRAQQLAEARKAIVEEAGSLQALVNGFNAPGEARSWLVRNAPGLGPKQASMFLRNAGVSYDLAVLDRHVLNYMSVIGLLPDKSPSQISGIKLYCRHESTLSRHAEYFDCPVGLLDWAIWIVMRVANRRMEHMTV